MGKMINRRAVLDVLRRNLSKGYKDVDGDWVSGTIDKKAIEEVKKLDVTELSSTQPQQWIPVTERLPERGKTIMCCNKHGSVFTSALTFLQIHENRSVYACFGQHHGIIAWMPLPEPYREEGNGNIQN